MSLLNNRLELLSPAKDIHIAKQAILHGADAIYIGGPSFGARRNAGNSVSDIANLVEFAHQYYAKIFVTLNTILHDHELEQAEQLINQLYNVGIDALIVQDMGILQLDIPPVDIHASTQTDIRTVEKAQFLSEVGFSQIVVARELNLKQIKRISDQVDANIEYFIHGALCVSYSGQCYLSYAKTGRSANRGDCSQPCRLPYTLQDEHGHIIAQDRHLLSMKDNNQANNLLALIDAGVRSFKIEGRYKEVDYVKNITSFYRQQLDKILTDRTDLKPASSGRCEYQFIADPQKTFHRGSTDYFVHGRQPNIQDDYIGAFDSPKFLGMQIGHITQVTARHIEVESSFPLVNGDGFNVLLLGEVIGFKADKVEKIDATRYRLMTQHLPHGLKTLKLPYPINRNMDHQWQQQLAKESAQRRVAIDLVLTEIDDKIALLIESEEGIRVQSIIDESLPIAQQPERQRTLIEAGLTKLGQTIYYARTIEIKLTNIPFIANSQLNQLRRHAIELLSQARMTAYQRKPRKKECHPKPIYPNNALNYLANIYNHKAKEFYLEHGVKLIEPAYEMNQVKTDTSLMITKHCLRHSFNLCPKQTKMINGERNRATPLQLIHNNEVLTLKFDCKACEMQVWGKIKKHVSNKALLGSEIILISTT